MQHRQDGTGLHLLACLSPSGQQKHTRTRKSPATAYALRSCSPSSVLASVCTGGPDARLQAPWYAARDNYQSVMRCNAWPCSRNLFAPANPRSVTYTSAAERDAAAPVLKAQADVEWALDEQLMQVGLSGVLGGSQGRGRGFVLSTFASGIDRNAVTSLSFDPHNDPTPCCSSCCVCTCCCHRRCCCSCTPGLQLKLRAAESKDHMMDHLARWNAMNGDVLVVALPEAVCCTCGSGSASRAASRV